jgi:transmembrane sensor
MRHSTSSSCAGSDCCPGETSRCAAFATFVRRSPIHLLTYLRHRTLETELAGLDPERRIDVEALIAKARSRSNGTAWTHMNSPPQAPPVDPAPAPRRCRLAPALAYIMALLAISAAPFYLQWRDFPHATYATAIGERREIVLPDHTRLVLNTNSKVIVDFSPAQRKVRVLEGEVLITVHHQRRWPFQARVGNESVQDLGTQFDIRIMLNGSSIVVSEGAVVVRHVQDLLQETIDQRRDSRLFAETDSDSYPPVRLAAGDEARFTESNERRVSTEIYHLPPTELANRISWTSGFLGFSGQTLQDAVEEFGRYTPLQIQVDPAVAQLSLGGRFNATDPITFVRSLERLGVESDVDAVLRANGRVIHLWPAQPSSPTRSRHHQQPP